MATSKKASLRRKVPMGQKKQKLSPGEEVAAYMKELKHPFKKEIEAVRQIIISTDKRIGERIKWKAPSYYYIEDMVTFNGWARDNVHLVFHHPSIATIKSPLLQGDYKDRRMAYFSSMAEVLSGEEELRNILRKLIKIIDKKHPDGTNELLH